MLTYLLTYAGLHLDRLKTDKKALESIEYAIIAAIIVGVAFVGYHSIFNSVNTVTGNIATNLNTVGSGIGS